MRKISSGAWLVVIVLAFLVAGAVMGQLQQSGGPGSSVTLLAGSAVAGKVGVDQTTPGTTNGVSVAQIGATTVATGNGVVSAGVIRVAIASDNTAFTVNAAQSGTYTVQPGNTANTTAWLVKTSPSTACGTTAFTPAWQAVPTSSTALTATTSCVVAIMFTNTNASAQTVTVTDGQGSPITVLNAFSIPANSELTLPFYGSQMTTGIKWSAGGSGVTGTVVAYQ